MKEIKAIIFDLDGTLIDSVPELAYATNQMLSSYGYDSVSEDEVRDWVGNGADVLVGRALSRNITINPDLDDALRKEARARFDGYYQDITSSSDHHAKAMLYPNVEHTLNHLHEQGYTLTLLTNKPSQFLPDILKGFGFSHLFKHVIGADTLAAKKPDPIGIHWICEQENLRPEQTVMVGDSKHDIATGKNAGAHTFALTYGYNHGEPISDANPDRIADDISELITWLYTPIT